ncbi:hypothetical protein B0H10DRAFT_2233758 [Mycena sp. CBHHK59/15]|nr:hypothetical protein B0H10DRAFT_2233758 [Mycena sp. CBHHK59/15]
MSKYRTQVLPLDLPWARRSSASATRSQYPAARTSNDPSILEVTPFSDLAGLMSQHLHFEKA